MKTTLVALMLSLPLLACGGAEVGDGQDPAVQGEEAAATVTAATVGKKIFNDTNLSQPAGEACATCHNPAGAFIDTRGLGPTSQGATAGLFGPRNTPSIVYASYTPPLGAAGDEAGYSGGLFWDGRAINLQNQAGGPMLNPIEMGNTSQAAVVTKVQGSSYASQFKKVYGANVFSDPATAFTDITLALAAFQTTAITTTRFTSKYDYYLAGQATLSASEAAGLALFEDPKSGGGVAGCLTLPDGSQLCGCAQCHLTKPAADGTPPLLTDFGYDNLGIPKNPDNGFYKDPPAYNPLGANYVDHGLSASIHNPRQDGKFKAPTLRNIELTAPYGHNGYFADLASIVHFYNTRDVPSEGWPAPEVSFSPNIVNMGNLGLSTAEEANLVAFMLTLTDGFNPATGTYPHRKH